MTPPGRSREAARKRSTDQLRASACLGTDAKTSRAMRRMLPALRCWASIAVTTLSPGSRPTAAAYSARRMQQFEFAVEPRRGFSDAIIGHMRIAHRRDAVGVPLAQKLLLRVDPVDIVR